MAEYKKRIIHKKGIEEKDKIAEKTETKEITKDKTTSDITKDKTTSDITKDKNAKEIAKNKTVEEIAKNKTVEDITKNKTTKEIAAGKKKKIIRNRPSKELIDEIERKAEEKAYKGIILGEKFPEEGPKHEISKEERAERFKRLHEVAVRMTGQWKENEQHIQKRNKYIKEEGRK